jgi:hypothetical protein
LAPHRSFLHSFLCKALLHHLHIPSLLTSLLTLSILMLFFPVSFFY